MNRVGPPHKADLPRTGASTRSVEGMQRKRAICCDPRPEITKSAWRHFRGRLIGRFLDPVAGFPSEPDKGGDQANHDKHPVLDLEAQNGEMLDQKVHFSAPFLGRISRLAAEIYYFCISERCPTVFQIPTGPTVELPGRFLAGPEGDYRHLTRSPAGSVDWGWSRFSAVICAPDFTGPGYCPDSCRSRYT